MLRCLLYSSRALFKVGACWEALSPRQSDGKLLRRACTHGTGRSYVGWFLVAEKQRQGMIEVKMVLGMPVIRVVV